MSTYDDWKLAYPSQYDEPDCDSCETLDEHEEHEEAMAKEEASVAEVIELRTYRALAEGTIPPPVPQNIVITPETAECIRAFVHGIAEDLAGDLERLRKENAELRAQLAKVKH